MFESMLFRTFVRGTSMLAAFASVHWASTAVDLFKGQPPDHDFYVSTQGSDAGPGTEARPWRTIQHAVDSINPGETINVRSGVYHEEVEVRVSGSSLREFITLRSYPGEVAILDGSAVNIQNKERSGLFNITDQSYVTIEGFEIRNYKTSDIRRTVAGISVSGKGSNIIIMGNHIHDIATYAKGSLCSRGRSDTANAFGIVAYGTETSGSISQLDIEGNEVNDLITGCSEAVVVDGNVRDWTIAGNRIHDNDNIGIDAIGFEHVAQDDTRDQARDGAIADNIIENISSETNRSYKRGDLGADGIYVDGGASIIIEGNRIHNADIGIELASEAHGRSTTHITVRNNLIYESNSAAISIGGYAPSAGGARHCEIVGNSLIENDTRQTGSGELQIQYHAANNVFRRNLVVAGDQHLMLNARASQATSMDGNLYYTVGGSDVGRWRWQGSEYRGFPRYQAGTGQDTHSFFSEPHFVDRQTGDFRLLNGTIPEFEGGEHLEPLSEIADRSGIRGRE
jgi:parallel beta-helix repeat protein